MPARDDQLVEKLWPDFVGRSEGVPPWKQLEWGQFLDDLLFLLHFDQLQHDTSDNLRYHATNNLWFLNWASNASQTLRGNVTLVPSLWYGYPACKVLPGDTNLVENPSFELSATTFWSTAANCAVGLSSRWYVNGGSSLQMICTGAGAAVVRNPIGAAGVAVGATTDYEFSAYYWTEAIAAAATVSLEINWYTAAAAFISTSVVDTEADPETIVGRRLAGVVTSPATAAFASLRLVVNNPAANDAVFWDSINFIQHSYVTHQIDGDMGDGYAWSGTPHASTSTRIINSLQNNSNVYMFNGKDAWSIHMWVQAPRDYDDTFPTANAGLWDMSDGTNNNRIFLSYNTGTPEFSVFINGAYRLTGGIVPFYEGDWLHIAITFDFANDEYILYLNGQELDRDTTALAAPTGMNQWNIGSNYIEVQQCGWAFAEVAALDRVLTATEILDIWHLRRPIVDQRMIDLNDEDCGIVAWKSAVQAVGSGAWANVQFDTITYREGGIAYDSTNYRFMIPFSGWYTISAAASFASNNAGRRGLYITRSGTIVRQIVVNTVVGAGTSLALSCPKYCKAGDYIDVFVYQNSGGALNLQSVADYTPFVEIVKLRREMRGFR